MEEVSEVKLSAKAQASLDIQRLLTARRESWFESIPPLIRDALDRHLDTLETDLVLKQTKAKLHRSMDRLRRFERLQDHEGACEYLKAVQAGKHSLLTLSVVVKEARKCNLAQFLAQVQRLGVYLE